MRKYNVDEKLTFGKYRGMTVKDIAKVDRGYLLWARSNIKNFQLSNEGNRIAEGRQKYTKRQQIDIRGAIDIHGNFIG